MTRSAAVLAVIAAVSAASLVAQQRPDSGSVRILAAARQDSALLAGRTRPRTVTGPFLAVVVSLRPPSDGLEGAAVYVAGRGIAGEGHALGLRSDTLVRAQAAYWEAQPMLAQQMTNKGGTVTLSVRPRGPTELSLNAPNVFGLLFALDSTGTVGPLVLHVGELTAAVRLAGTARRRR